MNNKKLLVFDFDGTIADTRALWYHAMYKELKHRGYKYEDVGKVIDMGENLKKTLGKFGLNFFVTWILKRKVLKQVKGKVNDIKKCKDVDSIAQIKEKKILVTNSLKEFVLPVLKHLKLRRDFREIYGEEDFSDKAKFISSYLKKHNISKKDCFYIGDRVADIKTARDAGCISVIVLGKCAWDSRKELLTASPDFVIEDIAEINHILSRLDRHN